MTFQSSHSTLDEEDPPAYAQVIEGRDLIFDPTITYQKKDVISLLCLKLIGVDMYFTGILFVFSFMSQITIQHALLSTCIPLFYLIVGCIGKIGFTNERLALMMLYSATYYTRVLLDLGSLVRLKLLDSINTLLLSPSKFAFSILMIGTRAFTQTLMPCEDIESFQILGYCPDQFNVNGEPFSPWHIYMFVSVFEVIIGIVLLYKIRMIYIDECVPIIIQSFVQSPSGDQTLDSSRP